MKYSGRTQCLGRRLPVPEACGFHKKTGFGGCMSLNLHNCPYEDVAEGTLATLRRMEGMA